MRLSFAPVVWFVEQQEHIFDVHINIVLRRSFCESGVSSRKIYKIPMTVFICFIHTIGQIFGTINH